MKRLICFLRGHLWETRVIVPGKYVRATTEICTRCGAGQPFYKAALVAHTRFQESRR